MTDDQTVQNRLKTLRDLIASARSMPMSASCVINRAEALAAIDDLAENLPGELAEARGVLADRDATVSEGEAEAQRIITEARDQAAGQASGSSQAQAAQKRASQIIADARSEAEAFREEADIFVDARMASLESVLAKTNSQVRTARRRLAERSVEAAEDRPTEPQLPSLD